MAVFDYVVDGAAVVATSLRFMRLMFAASTRVLSAVLVAAIAGLVTALISIHLFL